MHGRVSLRHTTNDWAVHMQQIHELQDPGFNTISYVPRSCEKNWRYVGVTLASRWRHVGVTLALRWRHIGVTLALRWRHLASLGVTWRHLASRGVRPPPSSTGIQKHRESPSKKNLRQPPPSFIHIRRHPLSSMVVYLEC